VESMGTGERKRGRSADNPSERRVNSAGIGGTGRTVRREWRMAMMAAMKKVLSPISLIRIIVPLFTKPSRNSLS